MTYMIKIYTTTRAHHPVDVCLIDDEMMFIRMQRVKYLGGDTIEMQWNL